MTAQEQLDSKNKNETKESTIVCPYCECVILIEQQKRKENT